MPRAKGRARVYIALLRAVNVGGRGKLDMGALRAACEEAGLERVSTYIQSGNVVFESENAPRAVKALLDGLLRERFSLASVSVVREAADLAAIVEGNPFPDAARERPSRLLASVCEGVPAAGARAALAAYRGPERLHLGEGVLYVDYVEGAGRSKLSPAFIDRALGTASTARNWNTMRRLVEMAARVTSTPE